MKAIAKLVLFISIISLFFAQGVFFINAQNNENTITVYGKKIEVIDGEVYGCYESIAESVKYLDPPIDDEVFMDDTPWSFVMEVADNWWYSSTYFYKINGSVSDNFPFIQSESIIKLKNPSDAAKLRIKNYASSVALDNLEKRLAVTLSGPYAGNNGRIKFIFRAPKSGYIVLYNEGLVSGALPQSVFKAFSDYNNSGYVELCVMKDEKVISDSIKISADTMTAEFPIAEENGKIKVNKGEEIVIYLRSFENKTENNTVFIDPIAAYTEIFEEIEPDINNLTNENNKESANTHNIKNSFWWLIYVLMAVSFVTLIFIFKKKMLPFSKD